MYSNLRSFMIRDIYLKSTNDQQALDIELLDTSRNFRLLVPWESSLGAEEGPALGDPASHVRPVTIV